MDRSEELFREAIPKSSLGRPESVALVVVDMQYHDACAERGLTQGMDRLVGGSMSYYGERLKGQTVPAIRRLLEAFRERGMTVIHVVLGSRYRDLRDCPPRFREWTRNLEKLVGVDDLWWMGNPDFQILEELKPIHGETVIRKTTNGAFNGSELDSFLRRNGINTLVLTGVVTSACVDTTARDAADRGYDCVIVDEATADYDSGAHEATLRAFSVNFGSVVPSAEHVVRALDVGSEV